MIQKMFAIYDSKSKAHLLPFFATETAVAQRHFQTAANDRDSMFFKYPEDYTLFHVGHFDDATGRVEPIDRPENLGLAAQYKQTQE